MNQTRVKKLSLFRATRRKRVNDLLTQLSQRDISQKKLYIEELLNQRKNQLKKIRQLKSKQISQPQLKPTKIKYNQFSSISPISSNQKYLHQNIRANLIVPNRAFASQANVISGAIKHPPKESPFKDKQVLSRKFEQYYNTINNQTGSYKKKILQQKKLKAIKYHSLSVKQATNLNGQQNNNDTLSNITRNKNATPLKVKKNKEKISKISMKKTFFQKYQPDKYRFYPQRLSSLKEGSIFQLTSLRKSSARQRQQLLKSVAKSRTIQICKSIGSIKSKFKSSEQCLQYLYSDRMQF